MEKLGDKRGLSTSQLKWLAMITMLIDHLAAGFGSYPWLGTALVGSFWLSLPRLIGRMAFPIFAFLLARGCDKTRSLPRYAGRLALFVLISQIPYTLVFYGGNYMRLGNSKPSIVLLYWREMNIFVTLLLGVVAIFLWKQGKKHWWIRLGVIGVFYLASLHYADYGLLGVLLIFCLWKFPSKAGTVISVAAFAFLEHLVTWSEVPRLAFTSWRVFYGTLQRVMPWLKDPGSLTNYECPIFVCLSLIFILSYNGERGSMKKWTAYVFYPAHLTAIFLLRELTIALGLFS